MLVLRIFLIVSWEGEKFWFESCIFQVQSNYYIWLMRTSTWREYYQLGLFKQTYHFLSVTFEKNQLSEEILFKYWDLRIMFGALDNPAWYKSHPLAPTLRRSRESSEFILFPFEDCLWRWLARPYLTILSSLILSKTRMEQSKTLFSTFNFQVAIIGEFCKIPVSYFGSFTRKINPFTNIN